MKKTRLTISLLSILTFSVNGHELSEKIDSLFSHISSNMPGCNVGVIQQGELIHKAGYGLANMELDVKLDGTQVHRIASVSKQFTAMAVLLLAEEGKIDLNDDIRKHLPELTDYGHKISINAMLGHFSGMGDYDFINPEAENADKGVNLQSAAGGPFRLGNEDYLTIAEFYDVVKRVKLRNKPNEKTVYSNFAYFLLSMLVEKVSGESLRAYSHKRIFEPLGMQNTFFSDKPTEIVKNRASGYKPEGDGYVTNMTNLFWVGDGGLHTTIEDMVRWDQNFYQPKVGKNPKALLKLFNTPNSQFPFGDGLYANGQVLSNQNDKPAFSHGGGWLGVSTYYKRSPEDNFSTVVFCNNDAENPATHTAKIFELFGLSD